MAQFGGLELCTCVWCLTVKSQSGMAAGIQSNLRFHNMHASSFVGKESCLSWTCGDSKSPSTRSVWALQVRQMKKVEPSERKVTLEEELDLKTNKRRAGETHI